MAFGLSKVENIGSVISGSMLVASRELNGAESGQKSGQLMTIIVHKSVPIKLSVLIENAGEAGTLNVFSEIQSGLTDRTKLRASATVGLAGCSDFYLDVEGIHSVIWTGSDGWGNKSKCSVKVFKVI